jgi:Family of unknown function (DUF5719)
MSSTEHPSGRASGRAAARTSRRTAGGATAPAVLVVLVGAALVLLAQPAPAPTRAAASGPHVVPVEHARLVCPATGSDDPQSVAAAVTAVPLRGKPGDAGPAVHVSAGQRHVGEIRTRGASWSGKAPLLDAGVRVDANGPLAAGLGAASAAVYDDAPRGLATAACTAPSSHQWFVGAASTPQRSGVLQLSNPTPGVAVVDLALYGPNGPVEAAGAHGLAIAPGEETSLPLDNLATGIHPLAVEVTARQGEVAASLADIRQGVLDPAGVDLLPPSAEPSRTTVVTGIPRQGGEHTLAVANPGPSPAVVHIEVLGPRGAFTPTGLQSVEVPAHAVAETRVPAEALDGDVLGLRLTSDQPVTAGVLTASGNPLPDHAFAASVTPTSSLTATPVLPGLRGRLVLSGAGHTAAIVDVLTYSERGTRLTHRTLDVAGGQTRVDTVPARAASVTVRVGGAGSVAAAMLWSKADDDGTLLSGYPLAPTRLTVQQPTVRYRLTVPRR